MCHPVNRRAPGPHASTHAIDTRHNTLLAHAARHIPLPPVEWLVCGNISDLATLDPATAVYVFDVAFDRATVDHRFELLRKTAAVRLPLSYRRPPWKWPWEIGTGVAVGFTRYRWHWCCPPPPCTWAPQRATYPSGIAWQVM